MLDLLRRVDPGFYAKEPYLLGAGAQVPRYSEEAQAEARLAVLSEDRLLRAAIVVIALCAYLVVTAAGTLDPRTEYLPLWAFAVVAVAMPRALPWWPKAGRNATWVEALVGIALTAMPALWTPLQPLLGAVVATVAITLLAARGRGRWIVLALAAIALWLHLLFVSVYAAVAVGAAGVIAVREVVRTWRFCPQLIAWATLGILLAASAYAFALEAAALVHFLPLEIAAIAVAYVSVCVVAGRIRRAELSARPEGLLSLPQSIVPLLDRSHDHAIICFR